ncbi:energy transducer TonB [Hymenobacter properus]|uniref:Energy transducer TonB n=1 Tax=Hymenobacter properus TaxID=2791026 RepID=A0A931BD12_9BACT|nr:energy transducer TonB [Hymenobacter properus]MBF9141564.1 energy transducer TonB [Hymenobacter properus]MBR7720373.1 energy transducer TonB [Microvirga sp. SRT04]
MLLQLPTFNAVLNPCPVDRAAFAAHPRGSFCGQCQRVVQDFSQSPDPLADLAAARAASPNGQVCGSFRQAQVAPAPTLPRRLRWFLLALVLVVGQGLTAREAWAQVRRRGIDYEQLVTQPAQAHTEASKQDSAALADKNRLPFLGVVVEHMPTFRGGGVRAMADYLQRHTNWPAPDVLAGEGASGRIFVAFTVGADGLPSNARVIRGFSPQVDAAVLKTIGGMVGFEPGMQNGHPVSVDVVLPVNFKLK